MKRHYLFGLGTGRCGSTSLAALLDSQPGAEITHGQKPYLPWILDREAVKLKVARLKTRHTETVGEVALFYLQSIETLLELLPEAKFIVLRRDKEKTISSFARNWKYNKLNLRQHERDYIFPRYPSLSLLEALDKYYDDYYCATATLERKYPLSIRHFETEALNSKEGIAAILDFARIKKRGRKYKTGIRKNASKK